MSDFSHERAGFNPEQARLSESRKRWLGALVSAWLFLLIAAHAPAETALRELHTLSEMDAASKSFARMICAVRLEATVCAASRPEMGVLILQDETACQIIELSSLDQALEPGDRIRLVSPRAMLRRRPFGLQLSSEPVVENDGPHAVASAEGTIHLEKGSHPIRVDWFNCLFSYALDISVTLPNGEHVPLVTSNIQAVANASAPLLFSVTNAECYEGYWESIPDYELLVPAWSGPVPRLDLGCMTRQEMVALRFTGTFTAPTNGDYLFSVASDDGALLFLGDPRISTALLARGQTVHKQEAFAGEGMLTSQTEGPIIVSGRIQSAIARGRGLELTLESGPGKLLVRLADAGDLANARLTHRLVRVSGLGRAICSNLDHPVLGELVAASASDIEFCDIPQSARQTDARLETAEEVQQLPLSEALQNRPVSLRGVVTSSLGHVYRGFTLQDETRGIYVDMHALSNGAVPTDGDYCEVRGHTGPGDFSPVVLADAVQILGAGQMPVPLRPTWNQLMNGSIDSQWIELRATATAVRSNVMTLLLPEGRLTAAMDRYSERELETFVGAQIRLQAALFAEWDAKTREVKSGRVLLRNATVEVETQPLIDPFLLPAKSVRELLMFDVQAAVLQQVRIDGMVLHASPEDLWVMDGGCAIRVIPKEMGGLRVGDTIEAVGYPVLEGRLPTLHDALIRRTGSRPLPRPLSLSDADLLRAGLDATLVKMEGRLLGFHRQRKLLTLELQTGFRSFQALLDSEVAPLGSLRIGSVLSLTGVYAPLGEDRWRAANGDTFELLLNTPDDLSVISTPPWWTLSRMLTLIEVLFLILALSMIWIHLLRRQVEVRTRQLHEEIRDRERAQRERALEAERARIARDLHDDLGSDLTEISVLASSGQHPRNETPPTPDLFHSISQKARNLVMALDIIVWAVDPAANTLQSLADYLSSYAEDYLSASGIKCRFTIPMSFPAVILDGRVRHNLFMAVKEALHNIVQHSGAKGVELEIALQQNWLQITISDDGRGFDIEKFAGGHGLKNLRARLEAVRGSCRVESRPAQGTIVKIRLQVPPSGPSKP